MIPSLVHNGDHNDSKNDFLFCYTAQKKAVKNGKQRSQWRETPEKLGDSPIPEFPSNWAPAKDKKGNFTFSQKNPFNLANFNRRRAAGQKISQALKKWGLETPGAKGDRIRRLAQRVEKCQEIATCVTPNGDPVGGENGGAYFRSERCNSRFCPRCARKSSRATMRRLCERIGLEPTAPPENLRFLTLTLPGAPGVDLKTRYKTLRKGLTRLYKSKIWKSHVQASIGKVEVTLNNSNWHVHAHFLLHGDYIENEALRVVWAESLKVDYRNINLPWITNPTTGKNAVKEICKYIQKPTAYLGNKKNGVSPWSDSEMIQFFDVFMGARVFFTTGSWTEKIEATKEEKQTEAKIDGLMNENPDVVAESREGCAASIENMVEKGADLDLDRAQVLTALASWFYCPSSDPPILVGNWTMDPQSLDRSREAQALWWERNRIYRAELARARRENHDSILRDDARRLHKKKTPPAEGWVQWFEDRGASFEVLKLIRERNNAA